MAKHADEGRKSDSPRPNLRVLKREGGTAEGAVSSARSERVLPVYDATTLVGLCTLVHGAAIERTGDDGDVTVELPKLPELLASVAVARCLTPIRLRGSELKAIRKILQLTLGELAKCLDERTAVETVSRWESEAQPMGGYAEKLFRLMACERLQKLAPGIEYNASKISNLKVLDPWRVDANYELPCIELCLIHMKEGGEIIDAWNAKKAA